MSLFKRNNSPYWWVKFPHNGRRIQHSTGTADQAKAQEYHDKLKASLWDQERLAVHYGTLYPGLLQLEQDGFVSSEWGVSDNGRRARYYAITRAGKKRLAKQTAQWQQTTDILQRFLRPHSEEVS